MKLRPAIALPFSIPTVRLLHTKAVRGHVDQVGTYSRNTGLTRCKNPSVFENYEDRKIRTDPFGMAAAVATHYQKRPVHHQRPPSGKFVARRPAKNRFYFCDGHSRLDHPEVFPGGVSWSLMHRGVPA